MVKKHCVVFSIFFFLFGSVQVFAQGPDVQKITLEKVIHLAAKDSVDMAVAKLELASANLSKESASSTYVPTLSLNASYRDVYGIGGAPGSGAINLGSSVFWRTTMGTELRASLDTRHQVRGGVQPPLSTLGLSISQDLLAGGWGSDNEQDILSTDTEIARMEFIVSMNAVLLQAARRYFALSTAQINLKIAGASVERAQKQFDDTTENIKRGLLAKGDIYVVEENLVFFQQQLLRAEQTEIEASTQLASLLKMNAKTRFQIDESLESLNIRKPDSEDYVKHPLLVARRLKVEQAEKRLTNANLNRLPSLALVGGIGFNGINSPFGEAIGESFSFQNPDATVGLSFSTPLSFAAKNAVRNRAQIAMSTQKELQSGEEISIKEAIQTASETYRIRTKILTLANRRFKLSELKLETEIDKFKNGVSRLPEVVRFQRDVDTADFARTSAEVNKNITLLEWAAALGQLHDLFNVEVK